MEDDPFESRCPIGTDVPEPDNIQSKNAKALLLLLSCVPPVLALAGAVGVDAAVAVATRA